MNAAEWREASREHARRIGHLNRAAVLVALCTWANLDARAFLIDSEVLA